MIGYNRWVYALAYTALFGVFAYLGIAVWFLFLLLAIYNWYRVFVHPVQQRNSVGSAPKEYGVIDSYLVDGANEGLSWGMYIQLFGSPVFIDIRKDKLLEIREEKALLLASSVAELEQSLDQFVNLNNDFSNRTVVTIGLHSQDPKRGEVFWEPEGHTTLIENKFER